MENKMFCFQCQETAGCKGCTQSGVCGKNPEAAGLQDLLIYVTKGLSAVSTALRAQGTEIPRGDQPPGHCQPVCHHHQCQFRSVRYPGPDPGNPGCKRSPASSAEGSLPLFRKQLSGTVRDRNSPAKASAVGVLSTENEDIRSLRELITYGLKGLAAYTKHANVLLKEDPELDAFLQKALAATLEDSLTAEDLTALALETGACGFKGMALLDQANTEAYGNPEITKVNIGVGTRPGILISGHDLRDLEMLLEQTKDTGVDVYTHSEMLPAHYYPAFKKYPHFVGNYGNAWWKQKEEFERFHGPILMTTNCIVPPKDS